MPRYQHQPEHPSLTKYYRLSPTSIPLDNVGALESGVGGQGHGGVPSAILPDAFESGDPREAAVLCVRARHSVHRVVLVCRVDHQVADFGTLGGHELVAAGQVGVHSDGQIVFHYCESGLGAIHLVRTQFLDHFYPLPSTYC